MRSSQDIDNGMENSKLARITLQGKREFTVKIVGLDPKSDIALLEINISD
jgi:S1-C subfamily serine protease